MPSLHAPAPGACWCSTAGEHLFTLTAPPALVVAGGSSYTEHTGASSYPSHDAMRSSSELRRPISISQHVGFESRSGTFWSPAPKKYLAFVTCEPRTLHPLRKVHSRGLQHMSAVFVPGPQAFVAAASDTQEFHQHTRRGPMLHEDTDHGLLRCRDHVKLVQRALAVPTANTSLQRSSLNTLDLALRPAPSPICFNRVKTRTS